MFGADEIVLAAFRFAERTLHDASSRGGETGEHSAAQPQPKG
jgi:hypothetical protein